MMGRRELYLEDHSLTDLIKIARQNLTDMQPKWKREVVDRILEIIKERLNEKANPGTYDANGDFVADKP